MPRCPTCKRRLVDGAVCPRDRASPTSTSSRIYDDEPPHVPGYRIGQLLGGGGFSSVWEARRVADGASVAIKVGRAATEVARARFAREGRALLKIGAPHVPVVYEHATLEDGRPLLVMELLRGSPLSIHLGQLPSVPDLAWVRGVTNALLTSLEAIHACGLIHRDLTPDNIFIADVPQVHARLIDLGIAKWLGRRRDDATITRSGVVIGTLEYMAPEQLEDGPVDQRTDIYALGVLLYELLTLRVPFVGDSHVVEHGHRTLRPPPPGEYAEVPASIESVCLACLSKAPERRPADVAALRRLLDDAWDSAPSALAGTSGATGTTGTSRRLRRGVGQLGDDRQPVVLLVVEATTADPAIAAAVTRRRGVVARQNGRRYVCGFSGLFDEDPVQAALAAAREIRERHTAHIAAHIAPLKVRRRREGRPPALYGRPISTPESWLPPDGWDGVLLTPELAGVLAPGRTRPVAGHPGYFEQVAMSTIAPQAESPLIGRDEFMVQAATSLSSMLDSATPGLFTVFGESGLGKSRLIRELSKLARRLAPEAAVLSLRATSATLATPNETMHRLLDAVTGLDEPAPPMESARTAPQSAAEGARQLGELLRTRAARAPLVVLLDDAHHAESAALDALEYATLDGRDVMLWVAVASQPRLKRRRPQWGLRAYRHAQVEIRPLSSDAASRLAAELLKPAEYPPAAALARLARWSSGSPHSLEALIRTLKHEGIVRRRSGGNSWYLVTEELDRLPSSPAEQWVAARQLAALRPELAACIRLCAVLGIEFLRDELEWVQNAADRSGAASSSIDTDVGLAELKRHGFLNELGGGAWSFSQAAFEGAVYKLLNEGDRARIHRDALGFWKSRPRVINPDRVLAAIARHAGASGARDEAADAHLQVAERARREHRDLDAEQHYTAALPFVSRTDRARRARALLGRGMIRYRLQRTRESLEDLAEACRHAVAMGAVALTAEILLEESTALDWAQQFTESAERAEQAHALLAGLDAPVLHARYYLAQGRWQFRSDRMQEAARLLERALILAERSGDVSAQTVALLLLGPTLVCVDRPDEARRRFDEVIALCKRTGDRLHLCAAYSNRGYLKQSLSDSLEDLRRVHVLARELGLAIAERVATHNLAEFLHWSGRHDEALPLAQRSYSLQRFMPEPVPTDALLVARIQAALGDYDAVRDLLWQVMDMSEDTELSETDRIAVRMVEYLLAAHSGRFDGDAWTDLTARAREHLPRLELLEVLYFHARCALDAASRDTAAALLAEATASLDEHPIWRDSFDALGERLG